MQQSFDERRYQVFVSSTFRDLQEERQKVLQAILELRAFPAGMEMFPSADDEQWAFIQREIESSDYYVVIVAGKYGSLAPDGVSFTEKEYDYAVSLGKPVMGFLFHDLGELKGALLEQEPSSREKLNAFRDKVKRSKLVKFYRNSDDLKSQVFQALIHGFQFRPQEGWTRSRHSRRIGDLEEITKLQKRVLELEAENAKLRSAAQDPRALLAQGDDPVQWKLELTAVGDFPAEIVTIEATWNELLKCLFRGGVPMLSQKDILSRLRSFAEEKVDSVGLRGSSSSRIAEGGLQEISAQTRIQFMGLGYVQMEFPAPGVMNWVLTERGRLQLALLRGALRQSASHNEEPPGPA